MLPSRRPALPPSVVELPGPFTHELVHTRGLRLHAAVAGEPQHPLIVLLHGSFGGWFDWAEVIAPLADAGFHVAAVDARGYGLSDKPPAAAGTGLRTAAGDLSGLIQALGHDSATLIGSDTGGTVAWFLATHAPERIDALISVSATHPVDLRRAMVARPWHFPWTFARSLLARLPGPFPPRAYRHHLRLNTAPGFHRSPRFDEVLDLRQRAAAVGNTHPAIMRNHRLLTSPVSVRSVNAQVAAPTLLIQPGQRVWKHLAARSRARATGPVQITSVPGTRNLPQVEDPAGFTTAVLRFLQHDEATG